MPEYTMNVRSPDPKAVFFEALERSTPEELAAHLDEACGDDVQLRERVDDLLKAHEKAGGFLQGEATTTETVDLRKPLTSTETQIGPYKLRRQIGEGGMGVVYLAEQSSPVQRTVALKIIKPGLDSKHVIGRFEAERQALALMDHPNIAKVLDAGQTESGSPYFVMELVQGVPITQYCDEQHLTPKDRLQLFISVCLAVQHAHQKGVIHRDIKPGNILVAQIDDRPVAKVIDFGIAKATSKTPTDASMFTQLGEIVGTLEYMSPEQADAARLDVDTRSDIYSLGVLLYELLTGTPPFDRKRLKSAALDEILRIIREEDPPKPSTRLNDSDTLPAIAANRHVGARQLTGVVRGELDWIVMKAIEKDRGRRYQTAIDFATDVQRYLDDEPILARPISSWERATRWLRRNPVITVATTVSLVAIAIGVSIAFLSLAEARDRAVGLAEKESKVADRERRANEETKAAYRREAEERKKAEAATVEQKQATEEAIAVRDYLVLDMIGAADPRRTLGREITVRHMLDRAAAGVETAFPDQPRTAATIRTAIGRAYLVLGVYDSAFAQISAAHESQKAILGENHPDTLLTAGQLALALNRLGRFDEQEQIQKRALPELVKIHGELSLPVLKLKEVTATSLHARGRYRDAMLLMREVWEQETELLGAEHEYTLSSQSNLALCLIQIGQIEEGERLLRDLLELIEQKYGEEDPEVLLATTNLAVSLSKQERHAEAEVIYRAMLNASRRVLGDEHPRTLQLTNNLAFNLNVQNRSADAIRIYDQLLETNQRVLGPKHPTTLTAINNAAASYLRLGDNQTTERLLTGIVETAENVFGPLHPTTNHIIQNLAQAYFRQQKPEDVEALLSGIVMSRTEKYGPRHATTLSTMLAATKFLVLRQMYSSAMPIGQQCLNGYMQEVGTDDQRTLQARELMAASQLVTGDYHSASDNFEELVSVLKRTAGETSIPVMMANHNLGTSLMRQGDIEGAIAAFEQFIKLQTQLQAPNVPTVTAISRLVRQLKQGRKDLLKSLPDVSLTP